MSKKQEWKYCVVGNIIKEHFDENGIQRCGTVAFRGGTRVYLEGKNYNHIRDCITVLGLNRHRHLAYEYIPFNQIENVRFMKTYRPSVMEMMYEYEGHDGWWGNTDEDGLDAKQFATKWPNFPEYKEEDEDK